MNTVRHNNLSRRWVTVLLLVLSAFTTYAQQQQSNVNSILQDTALYQVFGSLAAADSNVISILHLGDSHVQAGYFPMTVAALLQNQFGYAGRGYVFPYNLAGTNGPDDYRWNSTTRWSSERVVDRNKSEVLGPGAIVISSNNDAPTLSFTGKQDGAMDNNFRKVTLLYDAGNTNNTLVVPDATVNDYTGAFSGFFHPEHGYARLFTNLPILPGKMGRHRQRTFPLLRRSNGEQPQWRIVPQRWHQWRHVPAL